MDSPSLHMNIEVLVICGEMPSRGRLYTWVHLGTNIPFAALELAAIRCS